MIDQSIIFVFVGILLIGAVLLVFINFAKKGIKRLDPQKYRAKWLEIEHKLSKENPDTFSVVILSADNLLDQALKDMGVAGRTMGERMKNINQKFSNANAVWSAHKIRNQIAHEVDVRLDYDQVRQALAGFKQALQDMGAL